MTAINAFCTQSSVVVVAGKGGVGKSTLSATVASLAARNGVSVLLVELEAGSGPSTVFGHHGLTADEVDLSAGGTGDRDPRSAPIRARTITPDDALVDYLVDHGFGRAARRLAKSGMLDVAASAIPGLRDILVLGEVAQLERAHAADLIVVDGPAAGHATTFLTSAQGLVDSSRAGPIHAQAADVVELLSDPARCQVVLVTLAEETPVNETVETALALEDRVGMHLGPVVVNCLYPRLEHLDADPQAAAAAAGVTLRLVRPTPCEPLPRSAVGARRCRPSRRPASRRPCPCPSCGYPTCSRGDRPERDRSARRRMESELTHVREPAGRACWTGPPEVSGIGVPGPYAGVGASS